MKIRISKKINDEFMNGYAVQTIASHHKKSELWVEDQIRKEILKSKSKRRKKASQKLRK